MGLGVRLGCDVDLDLFRNRFGALTGLFVLLGRVRSSLTSYCYCYIVFTSRGSN